MKTIKSIFLALLLMGPISAVVARADHGHGGGWHGGGWHGGVGVGLGVGIGLGALMSPWLYPYSYYPYPYYPYGYYPYAYAPAAVAPPAAPSAYVEQGSPPPMQAAPQAPQPSSDWFYCRKPEGYYPYVRECADGWQRVPSQPQR